MSLGVTGEQIATPHAAVRFRLPHLMKYHNNFKGLFLEIKGMEASPGIEPGCKDLQSSASPLRHEAIPIVKSER